MRLADPYSPVPGGGTELDAALAMLPPESRARLVEIAGPEAALEIGRDFARYHVAGILDRVAWRDGPEALRQAREATKILQETRIHPAQFSEWGIPAEHAAEALELKAAIDRLAEILEAAPMANGRPRGRPPQEIRLAFATTVAGHLRGAGVVVSGDPGGPFGEVLALLLPEAPERLLRQAAGRK